MLYLTSQLMYSFDVHNTSENVLKAFINDLFVSFLTTSYIITTRRILHILVSKSGNAVKTVKIFLATVITSDLSKKPLKKYYKDSEADYLLTTTRWGLPSALLWKRSKNASVLFKENDLLFIRGHFPIDRYTTSVFNFIRWLTILT